MNDFAGNQFGLTGISLLGVYMAFMIGCGIYFARRQRGLSDFFLGGRSIPAWAVLLAIVATETSSVTFVGTPSMSFWGDCSFLQLVFGYCVARVILALRFIPLFLTGELFTIYQHLGKAYGPGVQRLAGVLFFVTKALAAGVRHYCAALVLQIVTGWHPVVSIVVMGLVSLIYTGLGGLSAVVWTEVVQMIIMLSGAVVALIVMVLSLPSLSDAIAYAAEAGRFHLFNLGSPFALNYNLWNGLIGGTFLCLASHGADQDLVQRLLACKSERGAKFAMVSSGALVLVQFALFLFIGAMLFSYHAGQHESVAFQPSDSAAPEQVIVYEDSPVHPETATGTLMFESRDGVFPHFIVSRLSPLVAAFVIAAIFAAAMSSTASALNSLASTTMTDFVQPLRKREVSERADLVLSRILTCVWCVVIMVVAFLSMGSKGILETALAVASFTFGSLLGAFLLAVFTRCRHAAGTAVGMLLGVLVAIVLAFVLDEVVHWTWRIPIAASITVASGFVGAMIAPEPPQTVPSS